MITLQQHVYSGQPQGAVRPVPPLDLVSLRSSSDVAQEGAVQSLISQYQRMQQAAPMIGQLALTTMPSSLSTTSADLPCHTSASQCTERDIFSKRRSCTKCAYTYADDVYDTVRDQRGVPPIHAAREPGVVPLPDERDGTISHAAVIEARPAALSMSVLS